MLAGVVKIFGSENSCRRINSSFINNKLAFFGVTLCSYKYSIAQHICSINTWHTRKKYRIPREWYIEQAQDRTLTAICFLIFKFLFWIFKKSLKFWATKYKIASNLLNLPKVACIESFLPIRWHTFIRWKNLPKCCTVLAYSWEGESREPSCGKYYWMIIPWDSWGTLRIWATLQPSSLGPVQPSCIHAHQENHTKKCSSTKTHWKNAAFLWTSHYLAMSAITGKNIFLYPCTHCHSRFSLGQTLISESLLSLGIHLWLLPYNHERNGL